MIIAISYLWKSFQFSHVSHVLFFLFYFCFNLVYSSFFQVHLVYFREAKLVTLLS